MIEQRPPAIGVGENRPAHAQLVNMGLALRTLLDCIEADYGEPRMGLFYGFSGYGKSVAAAFAAGRTDALYIEAKKVWTLRFFLETIAKELGLPRVEKTAARIFQQIVDALAQRPRPIIVDEMDYLADREWGEIIRDIHDATRAPILMIGEESLPSKLQRWERFDNRILVATAAQPSSLDDALLLRDHYCLKVAIADDLVEAMVRRTKGVTRRIVTNLKGAQREAMLAGAASIDLAWWGNRPIKTGDVELRRAA